MPTFVDSRLFPKTIEPGKLNYILINFKRKFNKNLIKKNSYMKC